MKQNLHKLEGEPPPITRAKYLAVGSESWNLKKSDIKAKDLIENECARGFVSRSYTQPNSYFCAYCRLDLSVETVIQNRQIKWTGQVLRMSEKKFPRATLEFQKGPDADVHAEESNNRGEKLWRLILENTLDHATSPNRSGAKIGRKFASRRQATEIKGVLLSETFTLRAMYIDVQATNKKNLERKKFITAFIEKS